MKVEVALLGSPSLIVLIVFMDVKQPLKKKSQTSLLRSCVKVKVAILGSPSLIILMVSVEVKQN